MVHPHYHFCWEALATGSRCFAGQEKHKEVEGICAPIVSKYYGGGGAGDLSQNKVKTSKYWKEICTLFLKDFEYLTVKENDVLLVILCDAKKHVTQNERLDRITFESRMCFSKLQPEAGKHIHLQFQKSFNSYFGIWKLSLARLFRNMGTSTLIVDYPAIICFQPSRTNKKRVNFDQTSGANSRNQHSVGESRDSPKKMLRDIVTLLTIWWTFDDTSLMHIEAFWLRSS